MAFRQTQGGLSEEHFQEKQTNRYLSFSAVSLFMLGVITPSTHIFTSSKWKQSSAADISHHTTNLPDVDWETIHGLPVTTVARPIRDLARDNLDEDHLHHVSADRIHNQRLRPSETAKVIDSYAY